MHYYIHAYEIVTGEESYKDAYLEVKDGKFGCITKERPVGVEIVDYSQDVIAPGLVDAHIHGYASYDTMDNDLEGFKVMSEALLSCGVTSWTPSTLTAPFQELDDVCKTIGKYREEIDGARIQGIFFEGPYFVEDYKGAQNPEYMRNPSTEELDKWIESSNGALLRLGLAPERVGTVEFIKDAKDRNIAIAIGHSGATYLQAKAAVEAGANSIVHTYNGMSGLHHREPGMVGAALNLDNIYAEIICDGHHLHPAAAEIVVKCRGVDQTVLVTDCMRAGGQPDGPSKLGEFDVIVKDGAARLVDGGSLAGSILKLKDGVKNIYDWGIVTRQEAIQMATINAAKMTNIDHLCGKIEEDYLADFVVFDKELNLKETYLGGVSRYKA